MHLIFALILIFLPSRSIPDPKTPDNGVVLQISDLSAPPGAVICFDVKAIQFEAIIGMQYSLQWDPDVLAYRGVKNVRLPGLSAQNFGEHLQQKGLLTFAWLDLALKGITLPPQTSLFQVCFEVTGSPGQQSTIAFVEQPTPVEIVDASEQVIAFTGRPGHLVVE